MILELKQVFDIDGEEVKFHFEMDFSKTFVNAALQFDKPVSLQGAAINRAGIVTLSYTADMVLLTQCDRCLTRGRERFAYLFEHVLAMELASGEDSDYIVAEGGRLDIGELATSDILLELPNRYLCKDDCKGLCQVCGANLNELQCGCIKKEKDPRMKALDIFLE